MTERINGTLTEFAMVTPFAHTGEWLLQCDAKSSKVRITVMAKIEAAADYVAIDEFAPASKPINRYAAMPFILLSYTGNPVGTTIKMWTV